MVKTPNVIQRPEIVFRNGDGRVTKVTLLEGRNRLIPRVRTSSSSRFLLIARGSGLSVRDAMLLSLDLGFDAAPDTRTDRRVMNGTGTVPTIRSEPCG